MKNRPIDPIIRYTTAARSSSLSRIGALRKKGVSAAKACELVNAQNTADGKQQVEDFVAMLNDLGGNESYEGFFAFVLGRGWKEKNDGSLRKDGIDLESDNGRAKDPAAWLALRMANRFLAMRTALEAHDQKTIAIAQQAFFLGCDYTEWLAHAKKKGGGKKGKLGLKKRRFSALNKEWPKFKKNPGSKNDIGVWDLVSDDLRPKSIKQQEAVLREFLLSYFPD